ncbi:HAMP domain-containing histidine kinase [Glaciihabitans sp. INWT7]|uniref:sensor histidine kinase n=1 Tax=Glaciihabitans sp. INWT7 TaxID=2596912 RepID=UPI001628B641|nr:HAMP domain-containing sensor histidine kinase [Glaciihabitans sp. INWT7]QNE47076.1 HAMP domain-containing histidine kinase [Glaciihabitans sp. INWT7]
MTRRRTITVSVRVRILAAMLVVAAAGMTVAGGTAFLVQRQRVLAQVDTRLEDTASRLRTIAADKEYASIRELLTAAIQQITPDTNEGILGIIDGKPAVVPGSQVGVSLENQTAFITRINRETRPGAVVLGTDVGPRGALRYLAVPVRASGDGATGVYVAAYSIDAELLPIAGGFQTFLLVAAAALVAVGLVGWFVAGRLLKPLRFLRDTARRITGSDLVERIPVAGGDDVSELTVTVNEMLDRLQTSLEGQRQLLDDVGHELKTPITIVRGQLELLDVGDATQVAEIRTLVIDELDRMNLLVADISLLASVQRLSGVTIEATDVRNLTETVYRKLSAIPGRDWRLMETADAVAELDPARITQAWIQLASNANRHGTPGLPIEIGSRVVEDLGEEFLELWVTDFGPGIAPEAHERIFERFRREGEGRGESGAGLGLAIVTTILHAHRGVVRLESAPAIGSTFTLELPLGPALPGETSEEQE